MLLQQLESSSSVGLLGPVPWLRVPDGCNWRSGAKSVDTVHVAFGHRWNQVR